MLNLKKRTNIRKRLQILVLALGFVCCVLFAFLYFSDSKPAIDVQAKYGAQVKIQTTTPVYKKVHDEYKELGKIEKGQILSLADKSKQNMKGKYFRLKDEDYYIPANYVTPVDIHVKEQQVHYVPFNESLTTQQEYHIIDKENKKIASMNSSAVYPIYVKEEKRYGVMIHNQIVYIAKSDITDIKDVQNTRMKTADSIPVFMYHYFYSKANNELGKNGNYVEVNDFEEQLQYLKNHDYVSVSMEEIENFLDGKVRLPKHSVSITIDDGAKSIYEYAYPLLKKYNYQATLFLIANKFKNDILPATFKEMQNAGMELQSHSYAMHTGGCEGGHGGALRCAAHDEGVADTKKAFSIIGGGFVYCYPYGDVTDSALKIMKDAGVRMAFTTNYGKIEPGMDKLQLPRVRIFGNAGIQQFINSIEN